MNRYQHELRRGPSLQPAHVGASADGDLELQFGQRGYPQQATSTLPESIYPGQTVVMLAGGDNDQPTAIGVSPWLT